MSKSNVVLTGTDNLLWIIRELYRLYDEELAGYMVDSLIIEYIMFGTITVPEVLK